jgi:hypothetical protein
MMTGEIFQFIKFLEFNFTTRDLAVQNGNEKRQRETATRNGNEKWQ